MPNQLVAEIPVDTPTSARAYGWMLGGKDNTDADREFILATLSGFPECLDIARQNRQFLYRAVRYLVREAGIDQFIDLGCGLPAGNNVHQVAQALNPSARVAYVDIDPVVSEHGRGLLAGNDATTLTTADMRDPEAIVTHLATDGLIDFRRPVAVLFLSVGHHIKDSDNARHAMRHIIDEIAAPGSHLAVSQVVHDDPVEAARMSAQIDAAGIPWQTRTPAEFNALFDGLERVSPGMVNVKHWRPDATQPPLAPVSPILRPYIGATDAGTGPYEHGGVLRKP